MRSIFPGIALAVAFLAFAGAPALAGLPHLGEPAPALEGRTLEGREIDLAGLRGKVVVVNIWATWCPPCRAEMPMLDAFYRRHRAEGLVLIGLSGDRPRARSDVQKVMRDFAFPAALLAEAKVNALGAPRVLPITYVVDKAGVVRALFGLGGPPLTDELLNAAVEPLLRSP